MNARAIIGALALAALLLAGCGAPAGGAAEAADGGIQVSGAWARAGAPQGATGAAYLVVRNSGATADRLLGAQAEVAQATEIHTVTEANSVMEMRPAKDGLPLPAGGEIALKPGGAHIMLIGLKQDLTAGEKIALQLQFEKAGAVRVEAEVRTQP